MDKMFFEPITYTTMRLVKSEDLNHHGTLFAGRTAEWFVESGFIAAASLVTAENVVCLKIHGMYFTKPARPGEILKFESKIVYTGRSSLVANIKVFKEKIDKPLVEGFVTFVNVDHDTKPAAHNIEINPVTEDDKELFEIAKALKGK